MSKCKCKHEWVSNGGEGGKPKYSMPHGIISNVSLMSIRCTRCGLTSWADDASWAVIEARQMRKATQNWGTHE